MKYVLLYESPEDVACKAPAYFAARWVGDWGIPEWNEALTGA